MATVYSSEVSVGTYNRIRIKCDYSGTSATLTIQFRRTSSYTGTWGDTQATLTFNGTEKAAAYNYSGTVGTSWVDLRAAISGYTISTSGGTYNWRFNNPGSDSVLGCSGTITIPAQATAPTGLALSNVSSTYNSVTGTVSVTGWGGAGDATTRYRNLSVLKTADKETSERRYQRVYGNTMSSAITVDNSTEYGTMTIVSNTQYWLWWFATNGTIGTESPTTSTTTVYTKPAPLSAKSATVTGTTSIKISYTTAAEGNAYSKKIQYSLDGTNWTDGATVSSGSATSGNFTISNLTPGTAYTIRLRTNTTAGVTSSGSVTATTYKVPNAPTISVTNTSATVNRITYGTSSFNTPSTGTVYLYGGTASSPTTQLTTKTTTGNSNYDHTSRTGNTKYYYRARANNTGGWSSYSSEVSVITRPAAPTITTTAISAQSATIKMTVPSQGSAATMTLYYSVDGGAATSAGTIASGGTKSVTLSFSPNTQHTVSTYLSNSTGNSTSNSITFTLGRIPFYGSVSGKTKSITKLYGSTGGLDVLPSTFDGTINGNGITFSVSGKTLTLNGQNNGSGNSVYYISRRGTQPLSLPAGTYHCSPFNNANVHMTIYDGTTYKRLDESNDYTQTLSSAADYTVYVEVSKGNTTVFNNYTYTPALYDDTGHTVEITKLYGSVSGKTKRIF